ncbi:hypothetical protein Pmani_000043 [Petrolisthes manimaculis]|uniref:Uncharacterized protein n=1 Tax=Petrolisthes manimaculis TaxID=1843537 RepID=A0AAE1QMT8_9EUCA|nr:hypothetical protein Pmani_000043 [Petrolisthes manimaculis]
MSSDGRQVVNRQRSTSNQGQELYLLALLQTTVAYMSGDDQPGLLLSSVVGSHDTYDQSSDRPSVRLRESEESELSITVVFVVRTEPLRTVAGTLLTLELCSWNLAELFKAWMM